MKIENLNPQELEQLQTLLNKMNPTQLAIDPVERMIKDILDEFEVDRVAEVMDYLDWQWRGESVTPKMLKETAELLLRGAVERRLSDRSEHPDVGITNATGGLEATAYCDADKENIVRLELRFVLVSWDEEL